MFPKHCAIALFLVVAVPAGPADARQLSPAAKRILADAKYIRPPLLVRIFPLAHSEAPVRTYNQFLHDSVMRDPRSIPARSLDAVARKMLACPSRTTDGKVLLQGSRAALATAFARARAVDLSAKDAVVVAKSGYYDATRDAILLDLARSQAHRFGLPGLARLRKAVVFADTKDAIQQLMARSPAQ